MAGWTTAPCPLMQIASELNLPGAVLQVCKLLPDLCLNFLYQLCGPSQELDEGRLPLYLNYIPAGVLSQCPYMLVFFWFSLIEIVHGFIMKLVLLSSISVMQLPLHLSSVTPLHTPLAISIISLFCAGTSVLNMEHWAQSVRGPADGELRMMDFGQNCFSPAWPATCNQERYNGATQPPRYGLEKISTPLAILSGVACTLELCGATHRHSKSLFVCSSVGLPLRPASRPE